MKNKEKELDDYPDEVYASEEAFFKRFRAVEGKEKTALQQRMAKARGSAKKTRVTIYFDNRVLDSFKKLAEEKSVGYQTLINETLLSIVDAEKTNGSGDIIKEQILNDKKFLERLKTALAA